MPTLTHIFNGIEYTIGYTYYRGDRSMPGGTPDDPEDYEIIQIWKDEKPVSPELFDQILLDVDMIEKIREDRAEMEEYGKERTI